MAAALWALAVIASTASCSRTEGGRGDLAPTTSADGLLPDATPDLATESASDLEARLDAAAEEQDMCLLAGVFEAGLPSFEDRAAVIDVYRRLAEVVTAATEWVPDELADDWEPITAVLDDGAAAVAAADGDLTRPGVAAAFDGDDLQRSTITVARWAERNC